MLYVDVLGRASLLMKSGDEKKILTGKLLASAFLIAWIGIAVNATYSSAVALVSGAILIPGSVLLQRHDLFRSEARLVVRDNLGNALRITSATKYVVIAYQALFFLTTTWLMVLTVYTAWNMFVP